MAEIDGRGHLHPLRWWDDQRRSNRLVVRSERVLRFPSWVVRAEGDEVAELVQEALAAGGWTPSGAAGCAEVRSSST